MEKARILVVDDEEDVCNTIQHFLSKKGYRVSTALTKEAAIEKIKQDHPEIILLDVRLKEASGMDVLKEAKQIDKDSKVIMVTALDDEETMKHAKAWGADDYIAKPFTTGYLSDVLVQKLTSLEIRAKKARRG